MNTAEDDWAAQGTRLARRAAELADELASVAETFAATLERAAPRGDMDRRLKIAQVEREIARVERRNAARFRTAGTGGLIGLEHLPQLPFRLDE
jgi:hypothetical protein